MTDLPDPTPPAEPVPAPDPTETPSSDSPPAGTDTGEDSPPLPESPSSPSTESSEPTDSPEPEEAPDADDDEQSTEPGAIPGDTAVLLPTDGNWSSEQINAAEKLGIETPQGAPLSAAARETLRGLHEAIAGVRSWCDHIERIVAKLPR